jgi:predicted lysophospholipase L1 biosynthesis ABC-type transport system permease subunit
MVVLAAHAVCGFIVGYLTTIVLPGLVFYTTKAIAFMDTFWMLAPSFLVAIAFTAIPLASLRRDLSSKDVCLLGFRSILIALIPAALIGMVFADLHSNYFENREHYGDFFVLIGPAYFSIVLCALTAFLFFLFRRKTNPTSEHVVGGNGG